MVGQRVLEKHLIEFLGNLEHQVCDLEDANLVKQLELVEREEELREARRFCDRFHLRSRKQRNGCAEKVAPILHADLNKLTSELKFLEAKNARLESELALYN